MRSRPHVFLKVSLALCLVVLPFAASGGAGGMNQGSVTIRKIGPGAYYKKIVKPKKQWVIHVITVNLKAKSSIDVALSGNELGHVDELSSLAGSRGAIAAINGDFGSRERRPWNTYAEDGHFIQTERTWGRAFALDATEKETFIGHPQPRVKLSPKDADPIAIARVNNGRPEPTEVSLHNRFAREVEDTPTGSCSARLSTSGRRKINESGSATQRYKVVAVRCAKDPMPLYGGIVVSARRGSDRKAEITSLSEGQTAKLTWAVPGIENTLDVIGGNPLIVYKGRVLRNVVTDCGYLCQLHPRSAVGITPEGKVLFVVVDGRREGVRGMYLNELARWFVNNGADRAMTFDGGGAAEMWIKGEVVNTPSDGHERPVLNALVLLPGADADQPPAPETTSSSLLEIDPLTPYRTEVSEEVARQAFEDSAADPGSLGGLADFLSRRGADIPPWMEQVAEDLRANER